MITADEVINALEKALKATWADLDFASDITADALELLEQYRRQSQRKYYLLQKHFRLYGVPGVESITADEDGNIISHIRQMDEDVQEVGWVSFQGGRIYDLPAAWVQVGGEMILEEVIEWAEGL